MRSFFPKPAYRPVEQVGTDLAAQAAQEPAFADWIKRNLAPHRQPGYHAVFVSLKAHGDVDGDGSAEQYEALADLPGPFGVGEQIGSAEWRERECQDVEISGVDGS